MRWSTGNGEAGGRYLTASEEGNNAGGGDGKIAGRNGRGEGNQPRTIGEKGRAGGEEEEGEEGGKKPEGEEGRREGEREGGSEELEEGKSGGDGAGDEGIASASDVFWRLRNNPPLRWGRGCGGASWLPAGFGFWGHV